MVTLLFDRSSERRTPSGLILPGRARSVEEMIESERGLWVHPSGQIAPVPPIAGGVGAPGGAGVQGRDLWTPNGINIWGFNGANVIKDDITNTDTTLNGPHNLRACGYYMQFGSPTYQDSSHGVTGVATTLKCRAASGTGNQAGPIGSSGLTTSLRYMKAAIGANIGHTVGDYTKWVMEALIVLQSVTSCDCFIGAWDNATSDPLNGADCIGVSYVASASANWRAHARGGGTSSFGDSGIAAAASTVIRLKAVVSASTVQGYINGTPTPVVSSNIPTGMLRCGLQVVTRTAATKDMWILWCFDRLE